MTGKELYESLVNTTINNLVVEQVVGVYGKIDSIEVKKILSYKFEDYFLESEDFLRALSLDEIINAKENFQVDFPKKQVIPLFDLCDNDFIVYHVNENKWSIMNITDSIFSLKTTNLLSLLE